jgi:DMSO/TMAO reductase YedYZ molybdopterin-dependent catalytic subunit
LKQNIWIFRTLILVVSIFIITFSISCTAATQKPEATPGEKILENSQSSENQPGAEKETTTAEVQSSQNESNPTSNTENQNPNESKTTELPVGGLGPGGFGNEQVDGLHLTGTPIKVDINTYRLKVSGAVKKELSLTFDDVKKMPSERVYSDLVCPGFFTDSGYWTGVKIIDILTLPE